MNAIYQIADNIVTSLGFTTEDNLSALNKGISGLRYYANGYGLTEPFVASVIDNEELDENFCIISKLNHSNYTRFEKIAIISVADAVQRAAIDPSSSRTLFIISTTKGNVELISKDERGNQDDRVYLWHSANVIRHFFKNANNPIIVSSACISGVAAQILAQRYLQAGDYDHVVVMGADVLSKFIISGFQSFFALSTEKCKPFDKNRKGLNLGEGAATIVYSRVRNGSNDIELKYGSITNDANHISGPDRNATGMVLAIRNVLKHHNGADVGFINAHGTATIYNDEMESLAFSKTGLGAVPISSFKGYFGHTLGAAGVLESIVTSQTLKHGILYKSIGYEVCGTTNELNIVMNTHSYNFNSCIKTISGFGGCNAALLFIKHEI